MTEPDPIITAAADGLPPRQRQWAMAAILLATAMITLDMAIAFTALPAIATALGASATSAIWVVNAFQLAMVTALLPLSAVGEIIGQRRVYIAGLILFTAAALVSGFAWSLPTLIAARALQGLSASAMSSVNVALIRFIYPARLLGRGVGVQATTVAVSFVAGPVVASAVLSVASWHWLFLLSVPIGLAALAITLPQHIPTDQASHKFDALAAVLSGGAFGLLLLGVSEAAQGAPWPRVAGEWIGAVSSGFLSVRRQATHPAPILATDLFRRRFFSLSAATATCSFTAQGLAFVSLPFLFHTVMGRSVVETGLLMTSWSVSVAIAALISGRMADRHSPAVLSGAGLVILGAGFVLLAFLSADATVTDIELRMAICGAGFGFFQSPNLKALLSSAPPQRTGAANGILATARLMGQGLGAALVAACFHVSLQQGPYFALWLGAGFAALGSLTSFLRLGDGTSRI